MSDRCDLDGFTGCEQAFVALPQTVAASRYVLPVAHRRYLSDLARCEQGFITLAESIAAGRNIESALKGRPLLSNGCEAGTQGAPRQVASIAGLSLCDSGAVAAVGTYLCQKTISVPFFLLGGLPDCDTTQTEQKSPKIDLKEFINSCWTMRWDRAAT